MAGCVRPWKTHPGRATFGSFCLNTLGVIITDHLCFENSKNQATERVRARYFYFFESMIVSSVLLGTTYNTAEHLVRWHRLWLSAASDAFACVLFCLCFPHKNGLHTQRFGCSGFVFAVIGQWLMWPPWGHLASTRAHLNSLQYMCTCTMGRQCEPEALETATDVQLSIVRLSNLTKRKSSWTLKTHWDPYNCSVTLHQNQFGLSETPASYSAPPS